MRLSAEALLEVVRGGAGERGAGLGERGAGERGAGEHGAGERGETVLAETVALKSHGSAEKKALGSGRAGRRHLRRGEGMYQRGAGWGAEPCLRAAR